MTQQTQSIKRLISEARQRKIQTICNQPMRERVREAYKIVATDFQSDTFVTLATNQTWSTGKMKKMVGKFFGHIDRWYLGHTWLKQPLSLRTVGIGFIEHTSTNIHAHMIVRFNKGNLWGKQLMSEHYWNKICDSGSVLVEPIYEINGLTDYCTKEMKYPNFDTGDQIIFLRDYFPA